MIDASLVQERYAAVRERLGSRADDITVVAVTKGFGPDAIEAARAAGLRDIGESYAQETVAKLTGPETDLRVHFIGGLQRNKVRRVAPLVDVWQSIDRPCLISEVAKRAPGAEIMIQVDISDEPQKGGCPPGDVAALVETATESGLSVIGLMGIAPFGPPELARPGFARLRSLVDDLGLRECSMGMSGDVDVALEEGTTMIRVGTALFGPRPSR